MAKGTKYPIHPDFKRWTNMNPPLNRAIVPVIQKLMNPLAMLDSPIVRACVDRRVAFLRQVFILS